LNLCVPQPRATISLANEEMPTEYISILSFAILAIALPLVGLRLLKKFRPDLLANGIQAESREREIPAEKTEREPVADSVFLIGVLFVIFDVVLVFLFPWATKFAQMGGYGLAAMLVFLVILLAGYAWLYMKGALDWI
jgi:NADH-quinone oxidoreductase subunit A